MEVPPLPTSHKKVYASQQNTIVYYTPDSQQQVNSHRHQHETELSKRNVTTAATTIPTMVRS